MTRLETKINYSGSVKLSLNGTSGGSWSPQRVTTVPSPGRATSTAIVNLFRNQKQTASTSNEVSFRDTDGDRIKFKIENDGSMTYYVNGTVKVHHLTKLESRTNRNGSVRISL